MRMLIYSLNYAPEPTSTGKYTGELAAWLAARGHEVTVIAGQPHYPQWEIQPDYAPQRFFTETLAGVQVLRAPHFIPPADAVTAKNRIQMELSFAFNAGRWWIPLFFRRRFDVVLAICPPVQLGLWPWLYRLIRRVPWVFHIQDLQVDAAFRLGMLKGGMVGKLLYAVESFLLRHATRVSTITEAMRQRIADKGVPVEKQWLVPNWANLEQVQPLPRDNDFRRELGLAADSVLFVAAGNMGKKQGLELLLEAAEQLRDQPRFQFLLVGSGADRPRLESLAESKQLANVRFLPVQPLEKLAAMLAAADVHLVIQKRNAADLVMPSKLTNILAAGRPAIATAEPGTALHQVLTDHQAGLAVAPEDPQAFIQALRTLAEDPARRQKMGENARAYAEAWLDQNRILERLDGYLAELRGQ